MEAAATLGARDLFKNKDDVGQESRDSRLATTHQNQINSMRVMEGNKLDAKSVSTTAGDGALVIWNLDVLSSKLSGLKI
jgi:actin related protein 2/3 complex subunit 1A/1B